MKALQSYIFRAISAIVVGALLVKYREETVTWLTILIGVIFFVSGVISCIAYISARRTANSTEILNTILSAGRHRQYYTGWCTGSVARYVYRRTDVCAGHYPYIGRTRPILQLILGNPLRTYRFILVGNARHNIYYRPCCPCKTSPYSHCSALYHRLVTDGLRSG